MTDRFEEPPMLFKQEQASIHELEAFDRAASEFRAAFGSGFGYAACARRNRELAEAAQRLAAELHRTAACYELAASMRPSVPAPALADEGGAT